MAKRVFFSFHYQDVIDFRANIVRNHNILKYGNGGYFDASLWESAKKQGDIALKRLINGGLNNTSVTAVLIGSDTYSRRWVQYEIIKSIECGNKILGIHINNISCKNKQTKWQGPNPFDYLGLEISQNGRRVKPTIWTGGQWHYYTDLNGFDINQMPQRECGQHFPLSHWFPVYDWVHDNGYVNFEHWII
ncbi:MTH538 TIR-like domain [Thiothrix caldifontis]|uniref:MTH538 TIR-like domain n=1 Tax=Thiothrix caldifontis TaxID=525918 RepID=A0A1H3WKE0_9GAMM|nr:TIR domain-containing protein [Thiothrix caldifontis]SDZ87410.1 MTH538 TIR-like domain [Thiothrix caldifontis]